MKQSPTMRSSSDQDYRALMAKALVELKKTKNKLRAIERAKTEPIAIIGMACRFPGGANTPQAFWDLLQNGQDGIVEVPAERWDIDEFYDPDPDVDGKIYTRYGNFLPDATLFDSPFFGISPREAIRMDPQQRLLLEVAWEALEYAGLAVDQLAGSPTGVFIGFINNDYTKRQLKADPASAVNDPYFAIGSSSSVASGRLSYLFDFQGPSMAIDSACSSSLVSLHLAITSLRNRECNLALVGGANVVTLPESMINLCKMRMLSADGRCKTFDAQADGFAVGEGCGVIVVKRLSDAVAAGDNVLAIIHGSAVNEDGRSSSLTAPNGLAQQAVIRQALARAKVPSHLVSYVETHGSGTALGDPIEVDSLQTVFNKRNVGGGPSKPLMIGTVKTNLGHLLAGAGVAGLIKTVLALQHRAIPPHLHLKDLNPNIAWDETTIQVPTTLTPWEPIEGRRLAGVSSFGWSGTNAHIVIEEAKPTAAAEHDQSSEPSRAWQLLLLSAKSAVALDKATENLVQHMQTHPKQKLADVAYTLQVGRSTFNHRRMIVCREQDEAINILTQPDSKRVYSHMAQPSPGPVAFMFPGVGDHYENMGRELYELEPLFKQTVDHCCEILRPILGVDLREVLFPAQSPGQTQAQSTNAPNGLDLRQLLGRSRRAQTNKTLNRTDIAQPAVFVIEYALSQLLQSWGIVPTALIGYSLGEYVAACVAGVLNLKDALTLVARRAQLIQRLPTGSMLTVPLSEADLQPYLNGDAALCLAVTINNTSVLAGPTEAIAQVKQKLTEHSIATRQLGTSHAFHSTMMAPIVGEFTALVRSMSLNAPQIRYLSNVTGNWITKAEATDPTYWARHLCQTVRFGDGLDHLISDSERVLLEVGPGQSLGSFVKQHPSCKPEQWLRILPTLRYAYERRSDMAFMLETVGKLWLVGTTPEWSKFYGSERRQRLPLPTYPFERQRYWIDVSEQTAFSTSSPLLGESKGEGESAGRKNDNPADWFYVPTWQEMSISLNPLAQNQTTERWLIFEDELGWGAELAERLQKLGAVVNRVQVGHRFAQVADDIYTVRPDVASDYNLLLEALNSAAAFPTRIAHAWSISAPSASRGIEAFNAAQSVGFYSLLYLAQAIGQQAATRSAVGSEAFTTEPLRITVLSNAIQSVNEASDPKNGTISPEKATILGPCRVIPQEYQNIRCRTVDIAGSNIADMPLTAGVAREGLLYLLMAELTSGQNEEAVAYRDGRRYVQTFKQERLDSPTTNEPLRTGGVYLITGGLGSVGLTLATYLAQQVQANLVLTSRSGLPKREDWPTLLENEPEHGTVCHKIRQIQAIEKLGGQVLVVAADVSNEKQMQAVIERTNERFGTLHGVIHGAGITNPKFFETIETIGPKSAEAHFLPKVHGLYVLDRVLASAGLSLDFCHLLSSLSSVLGGLAFAAYAAANLFMDAYAHVDHQSCNWTTVNWDNWQVEKEQERAFQSATLAEFEMTPDEGMQAFALALASGKTQLINSTGDLQARIRQWVMLDSAEKNAKPSTRSGQGLQEMPKDVKHPRPALGVAYVAPSNEVEEKIASIWSQILRINQIGVNDNFFELGGNSLIGTQLMSRLRQTFQINLPLSVLFDAPTVADVAIEVEIAMIEEIEAVSSEQ